MKKEKNPPVSKEKKAAREVILKISLKKVQKAQLLQLLII